MPRQEVDDRPMRNGDAIGRARGAGREDDVGEMVGAEATDSIGIGIEPSTIGPVHADAPDIHRRRQPPQAIADRSRP